MSVDSAHEIRVAGPGDARALEGLIAGFRDHLRATSPSDAELARAVPEVLADPRTEFCVALAREGNPVGYTQTRFFPSVWAVGTEAFLEDLFVVEPRRGSGLGRELLVFAVARARARGALLMGLETNEQNARALRLYAQAGFRLQGHALWPEGREVRLVKRLDAEPATGETP